MTSASTQLHDMLIRTQRLETELRDVGLGTHADSLVGVLRELEQWTGIGPRLGQTGEYLAAA
jgi:hypothetical protein